MQQAISAPVGCKCKVQCRVNGIYSGFGVDSVVISIGNGPGRYSVSTEGLHKFKLLRTADVDFRIEDNSPGSYIDDVSVREVLWENPTITCEGKQEGDQCRIDGEQGTCDESLDCISDTELIVNGQFTGNADGWFISMGQPADPMYHDNNVRLFGEPIYQPISAPVGSKYKVQCRVNEIYSGFGVDSVVISIGNGPFGRYSVSTEGLHKFKIERTADVDFRIEDNSPGAEIDDVSVRKVLWENPEIIIPVTSCDNPLDQKGATYVVQNDLVADYESCFSIEADDITLDGNGKKITVADGWNGHGIIVSGRKNILIKDLHVEGFPGPGIRIRATTDSIIQDVNVSLNEDDGIWIDGSQGITLKNIHAYGNDDGVELLDSNNNLLEGIVSEQNYIGILIDNSDDNEIKSSSFCGNLDDLSADVHCWNNPLGTYGTGNRIGTVPNCGSSWPQLGVHYEICHVTCQGRNPGESCSIDRESGTCDSEERCISNTELVDNGDFYSDLSWWTGYDFHYAWSADNGGSCKVNSGDTAAGTIEQNIGAQAGNDYLLAYTVIQNGDSMAFTPSIGGTVGITTLTAGNHVQIINSVGTGNLIFSAGQDMGAYLEDVSVRKVLWENPP
jgi:parallel beta-helix repeat protein